MNDFDKLTMTIPAAFRDRFPHGFVRTRKINILGQDLVAVNIGLIDDKELLTSGIRGNDPMFHGFLIEPAGDKWVVERTIGNLSVEPPAGSHLAMEQINTKFRKTTGDADRIVKTFKRFFDRLKVLVVENADQIYQIDKYPSKYIPR